MPQSHQCYRVQSKDTEPYIYDVHRQANPADVTTYNSRGPVSIISNEDGNSYDISEGNPVTYAVDGIKSNADPTKFFFIKSLYHSRLGFTRRYPYRYSGLAILGGKNSVGGTTQSRGFEKFHYDDMTHTVYPDLTSDTTASSACSARNDIQTFGGTTGGYRRNLYRTEGMGEVALPSLGFPNGSPISRCTTNGTDIILVNITFYGGPSGSYNYTNTCCKYRWDDRSIEVASTNSPMFVTARHGTTSNDVEWLRIGGRRYELNDAGDGWDSQQSRTVEKGRYSDDVAVTQLGDMQRRIDNTIAVSNQTEVRAISTWRTSKFRYDDSVNAEGMNFRPNQRTTNSVTGNDGDESYYVATGWVSGGTNSDSVMKLRFADDVASIIIPEFQTDMAKQAASGGSVE